MSLSPLDNIIHNHIAANGPIGLGTYMSLCLGHPQHGYYMSQEAFGSKGDFITAPEASQLFGEMLAIWVIMAWENLGKPVTIQLVELGPGRGTLMKDLWRGLSVMPELRDIITINLVEFSPRLQAIQKETLADLPVAWHETIATLPEQRSIVIANEFFDALPIEQAVFAEGAWHQRLVTAQDDSLAFTLGSKLQGIPEMTGDNAIFEYSLVTVSVMQDLCTFLHKHTGALLAIDYGDDLPLEKRFGDTVQALKHHHPVDIFAFPGTSDLTAHVSFSSLQDVAVETGCSILPLQTQREFLTQLGIRLRAEKLLAKANTEQAKILQSGLHRLVDPGEMGDLFKVLQVYSL